MGDLSDFQRQQIVGVRLAGASVTKTGTLLGVSRAAVSKVMTAYTNRGKISTPMRNSGRKPNLSERNRHTLKRIVFKIHRTRQRWQKNSIFIFKTLFPLKQSDQSFTWAAIAKPLITENNAKRGKRWCDDCKYVIWSDDSSIMLFTTSGWVFVWKMPKEAYNPEVKHRSGSVMIWAAISRYSAGPVIALHVQIAASPNNDAIFQVGSLHTHTATNVQSGLRSMKMHFIFPGQHNRRT